MNIIDFILWVYNSFPVLISILIALLAMSSIFDEITSKRRWWKIALLSLVALFAIVKPIESTYSYATAKSEIFSTSENNIKYSQGDSGNIILIASKDIIEPIDLKIKDTYTHLMHNVDYVIRDKHEVFINYEFGNNDVTNKSIAKKGLVFTYKARGR